MGVKADGTDDGHRFDSIGDLIRCCAGVAWHRDTITDEDEELAKAVGEALNDAGATTLDELHTLIRKAAKLDALTGEKD